MAVVKESIDVEKGLIAKTVTVTGIRRNPAGDWVATLEIEVEAKTEDGRRIVMSGERTVKGWQRGRKPRREGSGVSPDKAKRRGRNCPECAAAPLTLCAPGCTYAAQRNA